MTDYDEYSFRWRETGEPLDWELLTEFGDLMEDAGLEPYNLSVTRQRGDRSYDTEYVNLITNMQDMFYALDAHNVTAEYTDHSEDDEKAVFAYRGGPWRDETETVIAVEGSSSLRDTVETALDIRLSRSGIDRIRDIGRYL